MGTGWDWCSLWADILISLERTAQHWRSTRSNVECHHGRETDRVAYPCGLPWHLTLMLLELKFGQNKIMQKTSKMTETMTYGYSSESTHWELSNEYQHDRVWMVLKNICDFVLWRKVALALEGSTLSCFKASFEYCLSLTFTKSNFEKKSEFIKLFRGERCCFSFDLHLFFQYF